MSPRAACRLEQLGFDPVYDYVLGKVDWMAAGLPTVRADQRERRAIDVADRNPLVCRPATRLSALPTGPSVIVVNEEGVVLGRVPAHWADDGDSTAAEVMQPGPVTVRAHEPLDPLLARMGKRRVSEMLVTTPDGVLLGVVHRQEQLNEGEPQPADP